MKAVAASRPKKSKAPKQASKPITNAWVAAPSGKKSKPKAKTGGAKKKGAGGVFAAMMMDSDSD